MTGHGIRLAGAGDIDAMVDLVEQYRVTLEEWRPDFWRKAGQSAEMSRMWFAHLAASPDKALCLVAEDEDDELAGFLIATPVPVPPVYSVDGPTWTVDDFCVADPDDWDDVGRALWEAVVDHGRDAGWAQLICVSPVMDEAKNAMLEDTDLQPTSRWWSQPL